MGVLSPSPTTVQYSCLESLHAKTPLGLVLFILLEMRQILEL